MPAQANGLGSLCGIGISAESASHRQAEDNGLEDVRTERFWNPATLLGRPSACSLKPLRADDEPRPLAWAGMKHAFGQAPD